MSDKNDVVIINLDRPREVRFGHKALKTLVAMTGKNIDEIDMDNFDLGELEKIMYCGLLSDAKSNNETLKLDDMEDLLDLAPFHEIMGKMEQAMSAAFGNFDVPEETSEKKRIEDCGEQKDESWDWEQSLKSAIHIGISIKDYEEMTPCELNLCIKSYNEKNKQKQEDDLVLTYLGAYWQRIDKMPSLEKILGKQLPKKEMTAEQILKKIKLLNAVFGGEVKTNGN